MDNRLSDYVEKSLGKGTLPNIVEKRLIDAGWPVQDVKAALAAWIVTDGTAVPKPRPSLAARDTFLYFVLFATFLMASGGAFDVLFGFLNAWVKPTTGYVSYNVRTGLSVLMVAAPVYAYVYWLTVRDIARAPEKRESAPRRWLIYLTLAVASVSGIGSAATYVNGVLAGEGNLNGGIKILTVAAFS